MRKTELYNEKLLEVFGNKDYFQVEDLVAFYQSYDPTVARSTVNWRIYTLVKTEVIKRIGRGKFKCGNGASFEPQISTKVLKVNHLMQNSFPYLNYLIWHVSEINFLAQQLINKDTIYVEVERDAVDAVFEKLREKFKYVLRGKTNDDVYHGESIIVVRPLVTGSPVQLVKNVPTTTIEKLLVDLFCDKEFEFLHGNELTQIFKNAFSKYTINIDKLLRYASRKAKRDQLSEFIKTI